MNQFHQGIRLSGCRNAAVKLFHAATLALLLLAMAAPARAAAEDTRAVKTRVAPVYPEIARRMKIAGVVHLEVTVDAEGKVLEVKTISGNHMLSVAAEDAVRNWRFSPGEGIATVQVEVNFSTQ